MPEVLLYNLRGERGMHIRVICLKLRLRIREIAPEQTGQPIGALVGKLPPHEGASPEPFDDEMLVFVDFDRAMLDRFLKEIRLARIPGVALKCVMTPTNMYWSSGKLHDEIKREHEAMHTKRA